VNKTPQQQDKVELMRAGSVVSSFAGAFGASLRETRLTAILGYLIALKPEVFRKEFGITGTIESVSLETRHDQGRSDILIKSTDGLAVVEAKVDATDPSKQAEKYDATWRVLLTEYSPTSSQKTKEVIYRRWRDIADLIQRNGSKFSRGEERFVSNDLIKYMKEHNMIPNEQDKIINARDINYYKYIVTADFFLKGHLYGYPYEKVSQLYEARYFAPCFGGDVPSLRPGLQKGISYIAKIISVKDAETRTDFLEIEKQARKDGFDGASDCVKDFKDWFFPKKNSKRFNVVFLSVPRHAFNPPIQKAFLTESTRFKKNFSFDDLYRAWSGEQIWKNE
jgi:hypothetical protein